MGVVGMLLPQQCHHSPVQGHMLTLLSQSLWQEPVIPCVGWLLRALKSALVPYSLLPPHPQ